MSAAEHDRVKPQPPEVWGNCMTSQILLPLAWSWRLDGGRWAKPAGSPDLMEHAQARLNNPSSPET